MCPVQSVTHVSGRSLLVQLSLRAFRSKIPLKIGEFWTWLDANPGPVRCFGRDFWEQVFPSGYGVNQDLIRSGTAIRLARTKTDDKKCESPYKSTRSDEMIDIPSMLL